MNRKISMLMIIMSVLGILEVITLGYQDVDVVIRITCIVIISILELLNNFLKVNDKYISIIQLISILFFEYTSFYGMIFLLPIIIFRIFKDRVNIYISTVMNMVIICYLSSEKLLYVAAYVLIVNLNKHI